MKVRKGTISKKKQDSSGPDDSTLEELRVKVPVPNKARSKIRPTNDIDLVIEIAKYTTT
jgi:hypothetical protein